MLAIKIHGHSEHFGGNELETTIWKTNIQEVPELFRLINTDNYIQ